MPDYNDAIKVVEDLVAEEIALANKFCAADPPGWSRLGLSSASGARLHAFQEVKRRLICRIESDIREEACIIVQWSDDVSEWFAYCRKCGKRVSNAYAVRHELDDFGRYVDCGVEFKFVTTPYIGELREQVKQLRNDLTFIDVDFAG
jgi:hypothetical protein